jgi:protein PhnA
MRLTRSQTLRRWGLRRNSSIEGTGMAIADEIAARAGGQCELCGAKGAADVYPVPESPGETADTSVLLCGTCRGQIEPDADLDTHHWRSLGESMWSDVPAVKVMAWRMLQRLSAEPWAREFSEIMYLEDDVLAWAQRGAQQGAQSDADSEELVHHVDSNGVVLAAGDAVTLTKDLNVKGTSFVAKRGTVVRGIRLVPDNAAQIEGRVNGQQIVILTEFVKK